MAQKIDVPGIGVVEFPDGMTDEQIANAIKANLPRNEQESTATTQPSFLSNKPAPPFVRAAGGLGEAILQAASGLGSTVAGGLAALPETFKAATGLPFTPPGDIVRRIQSAGTYQPRSSEGMAASSLIQFPADIYQRGTRAVTGLIRGNDSGGLRDLAATAAEIGADVLPAMFGGVSALKSAARVTPAPMTRTQELLAAGRKEGLVATPSELGRSSLLQGISGKIRSQQRASSINQEAVNRIVEKELMPPSGLNISSLPSEGPLTSKNLAKLRADAYEAGYTPVKNQTQPIIADNQYISDLVELSKDSNRIKMDFPNAKLSGADKISDLADGLLQQKFSAAGVVDYIRKLRNEGNKNLRWSPSYNAEAEALGHAQIKAANALETLLERNLAASGNAELVKNLRDARTLIAKTHTVENALNDATGNVSARALASGKSADALTGELKTVADFANAFRKSTQMPEVFGGTPPVSPLDASMATIAGLGGAAVTGNASGLLGAGLPLLRPLATPFLFTERAQAGLLKNPVPYPAFDSATGLLMLTDRPNNQNSQSR